MNSNLCSYFLLQCLLASCAVIAQSLPHPHKYKIPVLPSYKREQYYVLHNDGDFKYGYDTGDGQYESAVKMGEGALTGFFGYKNAFGEPVRVDYTAGQEGFQPTGIKLPAIPDKDTAIVSPNKVTLKSAALVQSEPAEETDINIVNHADGSYKFSFDNSDSSRIESADSSNYVRGQYTYTSSDGQRHEVRYHAGAGIGFVPEGVPHPDTSKVTADLTGNKVSQTVYSSPHSDVKTESQPDKSDASYSFNYETENAKREETADSDLNVQGKYSFVGSDGIHRTIKYKAGSKTGFVAEGAHIPAEDHIPVPNPSVPVSYTAEVASEQQASEPDSADVNSILNADGSYKFSYNNIDSSRREVADANNNVQGEYKFSSGDGESHHIRYQAGADTGFITDHTAVAPSIVNPIHDVSVKKPQAHVYSASLVDRTNENDASYAFQYDTGNTNREESADKFLNIEGKYSYTGDDGVLRSVNYIAGPETGFVATGLHLPQAPDVVAVIPKTRIQYSDTEKSALIPVLKSVKSEETNINSEHNVDGSYKFSYLNSDSSRHEYADAANNVRGKYRFKSPEGDVHQVNYMASANTGFVPEEIPVPSAHASPIEVKSPTLYKVEPGVSNIQHEYKGNTDSSYKFSYKTDDSARVETSDANLNIKGEYSFVGDDGIHRKISYTAGPLKGFVATGDHIPKALPEEAHLSVVQPSTHQNPKSQPYTGLRTDDSNLISTVNADGSYAFSYTNENSHRSESGDPFNNVVGEYSYIDTEGKRQQVNYKAGARYGFVADGDIVPPVIKTDSASEVVHQFPIKPTVYTHSSPLHDEDISTPEGAAYAFSYNTPDSSRREISDTDLNIDGEYSYIGDDGIERKVVYTAGSGRGFVIKDQTQAAAVPQVLTKSALLNLRDTAVSNIHGTTDNDGSYKFSYVNPDSSRIETGDKDNNVEGKYSFVADGQEHNIHYVAGAETGFVATGDIIPKVKDASLSKPNIALQTYSAHVPEVVAVDKQMPMSFNRGAGASYSFSYTGDDSSRVEESDTSHNVKGQYSFVANDGVERTVRYQADSTHGFTAEGAHLPRVDVIQIKAPTPIVNQVQPATYSAIALPTANLKDVLGASRADASYSFSYNTPDSSRNEESDKHLNIKGKYSFISDDGKQRTVNYVAGPKTGFRAEGDHIPKQNLAAIDNRQKQDVNPINPDTSQFLVEGNPIFRSASGTQPVPAPKLNVRSSKTTDDSGTVVGNVHLHQYQVGPGVAKYGYAFSEI